MDSRATRQPLWVTIVLFTLLLLFFWVRHILAPLPAEAAAVNPAPFGSVVCGWFEGLPILDASVSVALVLMTAVVITRLVSRNLVFPARTYVFLIFLAIFGYGIFIRSGNVPAIASALLIAKASESFTYAFRRSVHMYESFKGAFLLGLAPLFYAPAAIFMPMLPVAMLVFMRGGRETTVAFAGMLLPMSAYSYVRWALGDPFMRYFNDLSASLFTSAAGFPAIELGSPAGIVRILLVALLAAGVVMSLGTFAVNARMIRTRAFRIYIYMIFLMLAAIGSLFLPCASVGDLPLLAVPFSVITAKYYSRYTGTAPNLIYVSTIAAAVVCNLLLLGG